MSLQKISYLSLFPEAIDQGLSHSLVGKARESGKINLNFVQIRDFAKDKHHSVDDVVFGGGAGMLLKPDVLFDAWSSVTSIMEKESAVQKSARAYTILLSPQGKLLTQKRAKDFAQNYSHLVFVCGHYEGLDERFIDVCVDEEMSIGDYVLTGGEFAAVVASDVMIRLIPSVVGNEESITGDSLENGLLKAPQYTRPREFLGKEVPEILLSGNHAKIEVWRKAESLTRTKSKRPDLYAEFSAPKKSVDLTKADQLKGDQATGDEAEDDES
jgi:tRNA (guanine37-N1)-methyltransferase